MSLGFSELSTKIYIKCTALLNLVGFLSWLHSSQPWYFLTFLKFCRVRTLALLSLLCTINCIDSMIRSLWNAENGSRLSGYIFRLFKTMGSLRSFSPRDEKVRQSGFLCISLNIHCLSLRGRGEARDAAIHRVSRDADGLPLRLLVHSGSPRAYAIAMTIWDEGYSVFRSTYTLIIASIERVRT